MRSKLILIICMLVLAMVACNPVQPSANLTGTPVPSTNTPAPTAAPTNTASPDPAEFAGWFLAHSHPYYFPDANNGWGVASNGGGFILRTVDGGATWLNATPPGLPVLATRPTLSVLDVNTAWVLVPNADFFTGTLYHTSDGGLTWTSVEVPFGGAKIQFLDASDGLALADRGAGAGSQLWRCSRPVMAEPPG